MRTVILGATGNVGSALLRALVADPRIDEIVGFSRRRPAIDLPKVQWVTGDVRNHDLTALCAGASAVVNLVWRIQPSRDRDETRSVDVAGTARVIDAVAAADVPTLVHASSVAAYAPGPTAGLLHVDESWPTTGIASSCYSRDKVAAERRLDVFEAEHPQVRVVRLRPALVLQRSAAQEIRRYFLGPFWPSRLFRSGRMPIAPALQSIRFQVVHAEDVAEAYRMAIVQSTLRGAYNVAAEPTITPLRLARLLGGIPVPVPRVLTRTVASLTWRAHLQPTPPSWLDLAARAPLMDTARLRALGWRPRHDGIETVTELLAGLRHRSGGPTPPLAGNAGGPLRIGEIRSTVAGRR